MFLHKLCEAIHRCCLRHRRIRYARYVLLKATKPAADALRKGKPPEDVFGDLWKRLSGDYPGIRLRPVFNERSLKELQRTVRWVVLRTAGGPKPYQDPGFFAYFRLVAPRRTDFADVARRLNARRDLIEFAYVEQPAAAPSAAPVDTTSQMLSPHHQASPVPRVPGDPRSLGGIGAETAWNDLALLPGNAGAGVHFVDIESGWLLEHEDLPGYFQSAGALLGGQNDPDGVAQDHGTGVLGIVCGREGPTPAGGIGVAPRAGKGFVSSWFEGYDADGAQLSNYPEAIARAVAKLLEERATEGPLPAIDAPLGDVIIVQAQIEDPPDSGQKVPLEAKKLNYDAIALATAAGFVVVEAGGNGDESAWCFDSEAWGPADPVAEGWGQGITRPLSREKGHFQDSGAILVGAANFQGGTITPFPSWPRGSRVDCFAWGFGAYTAAATDGSTSAYVDSFNGTSAATAIVAGAAILLQGIARQSSPQQKPLTPKQMRLALSHQDWNTHPSGSYRIGYMPRLEALVPRCVSGELHGDQGPR